MILYENTTFVVNAKASDYDFTAFENFAHEWSLKAQRHIVGVGLTHTKLLVEATSLDEVKIWLDINIPGAKMLYAISYDEYVKRSKISLCGLIGRKTY